MMKAVISGSVAFQTEYQQLIQKFEQTGIQVIDYPKLSDDLDQEYPTLLKEFFCHIEEADIFLLFNKKKKGIAGYIGPSGFAELTYALMQNLIHEKKMCIFLWEEPSLDNSCYEEVSRWIENQWVEFYSASIFQENSN
mgnify:CR=1 FL=1